MTTLYREKLPQGRATEELGMMAGVSRKTYEHAATVLDKAPALVVEATRKKELSINTAYEVTKLPEEKQTEISERIEKGENPRKVVADVKMSPKTKKIVLSVSADVHNKIKALAETQNKDINTFILQIIDDALSK